MGELDKYEPRQIVGYLKKTSENFKFAKISSSIIGVGFMTVAQWHGTEPGKLTSADILFWVGLALMIFGSLILIFFDESAAGLLNKSIERGEKISQLDDEIKLYAKTLSWVNARSDLMYLVREANIQLIKDGPGSVDDQRHRFGTILDFLCQFRHSVLLMGDEYWNFSIYLWNPTSRKLECMACRRPSREHADGEHRSWGLGEGHVGQAFGRKGELISANAPNAEFNQIVRARGDNFREYDDERYRSFASIPIAVDSDNPMGVLVATSDVPGRFVNHEDAPDDVPDTVSALREMAQQLALLIQMTHISEQAEGGSHG